MANFSIQCDKYIKRGSLAHLLLYPKSSVMDISFTGKSQREKPIAVALGKQEGKKNLMNMKALRCWGACLLCYSDPNRLLSGKSWDKTSNSGRKCVNYVFSLCFRRLFTLLGIFKKEKKETDRSSANSNPKNPETRGSTTKANRLIHIMPRAQSITNITPYLSKYLKEDVCPDLS